VHTVGTYPLRLAGAAPARARPGNTATLQALRAATVALASVGDEVSRYELLSGNTDRGLRGGKIRFSGGNFSGGNVIRIALRKVRWVTDASISGTALWNQSAATVSARLTVRPARGAVVHLTARWRPFGAQDQLAVITGAQGGHRLRAQALAP
jgi:hypothetical protein